MSNVRKYENQNWIPSIFNDFFDNEWIVKPNFSTPAINVIENEKDYKVEVAAPGMNKEDFNIHLNENQELVITVEKNTQNEQKEEKKYLRREFSYTKFQQAFQLPDNVDKEKIGAKVENGVLEITLPKLAPEDKARINRIIEIQ
ncbi:MAG: Hsp20/alpha crystallin family protein [Bacteroidales bacterium]|nr:Hsp20/alpha crystallin family protein [Bacteroidales bacterium]MDY2932093.1 Hsp20/alpha crystallin family protein [Muribaculaceae bacterium]MDD6852640.1 Hsp20/alpha crystallin family protein [Bacteroidales bacterium]MDD7405746.1 Hsp20/alpha crystallin family protein [Bacteroidales bacterium]MDY4882728.1 Hsp20/alpha crystallin family protein [Muribaculaceae bacterium]